MSNLIGFIIATKKGKFKPLIASQHYMEDDDDSLLHTVAERDAVATLDEAQELLREAREDSQGVIEVYNTPIKTSMIGNWKSSLSD
jgi:hypothetical protein